MSELSKVGQGLFRNLPLRLAPLVLIPLVLLCMGGSALCAGLIDPNLAKFVVLFEFLAFPPVGIAAALFFGLKMRKKSAIPLNRALAPMLGEHSDGIGSFVWSRMRGQRPFKARYYRYTLIVTTTCQAQMDLRFGLANAVQAAVSKGWQQRELEGGRVALARDGAALDRFLAQPGVLQALAALLKQDGRSLRSLYIKPGKTGPGEIGWVAKYVPEGGMTAETGEAWILGIEALASAAERMGS